MTEPQAPKAQSNPERQAPMRIIGRMPSMKQWQPKNQKKKNGDGDNYQIEINIIFQLKKVNALAGSVTASHRTESPWE